MSKRKIVFEYDQEPDFSWLEDYATANDPIYRSEEDMKAGKNPISPEWYNDPKNHVALSMVVYELGDEDEDCRIVDSLGGIDFLADSDSWATGTFYHITQLPEGYLRDLAREAGLPE